jgi:hypothetical protein
VAGIVTRQHCDAIAAEGPERVSAHQTVVTIGFESGRSQWPPGTPHTTSERSVSECAWTAKRRGR